jgi:hypothetical protein
VLLLVQWLTLKVHQSPWGRPYFSQVSCLDPHVPLWHDYAYTVTEKAASLQGRARTGPRHRAAAWWKEGLQAQASTASQARKGAPRHALTQAPSSTLGGCWTWGLPQLLLLVGLPTCWWA